MKLLWGCLSTIALALGSSVSTATVRRPAKKRASKTKDDRIIEAFSSAHEAARIAAAVNQYHFPVRFGGTTAMEVPRNMIVSRIIASTDVANESSLVMTFARSANQITFENVRLVRPLDVPSK